MKETKEPMTAESLREELIAMADQRLRAIMPRPARGGRWGRELRRVMNMGRRAMAERLVDAALSRAARVKVAVPPSWGKPPGGKR